MIDPVETINRAERRIAQVSALQSALYLIPVSLVSIILGIALRPIGSISWELLGYRLADGVAWDLELVLIFVGVAGIIAAAIVAMITWRNAHDFIATAESVDDKLRSKQEIVTLATMTGPATARQTKSSQLSPLFPVLWNRAIKYLERLDPSRAFPLKLGDPIRKSSLSVAALLALLAIAIPALIGMTGSSYGGEARRLRRLANNIANSTSDGDAKALAEDLKSTARALEDPKLPPEKKLEMLKQMAARLEEKKEEKKNGEKQETASNDQGNGKGDNGNGGSGGKGNSDKGQGQGTGKGEGKGQGPGKGSQKGDQQNGEKRQQQLADARKEISQARSKIQKEQSAGKDKSQKGSQPGQGKGNSPKPGNDPNRPGPKEDETGDTKIPKPGTAQGAEQAKGGNEDSKDQNQNGPETDKGDTHLGQNPQPGKFERFYKAGEHGPVVDLKNAKYVVFRIPPASKAAAGGVTVTDREHPTATTPYANVPLSEARIKAEPDEKQLVPPRYRELLQ